MSVVVERSVLLLDGTADVGRRWLRLHAGVALRPSVDFSAVIPDNPLRR